MGELITAPWGGKIVTSFATSHQVLRDKAWTVPGREWRFRQGEGTRWTSPSSMQMSETLPLLNSPDHTRIRRAVGNIFSQDTLASLRPSVEHTVDHLLDRFTERLHDGPADFVALVSEQLPVIAIGQWMGLPPADYALLRTLTHEQVHTQELFPTASEIAISDEATARLRSYFSALVGERRKDPSTDPVSSWIRTWDAIEDDPAAADAVVHSLALFMILAALETTSHLLVNAVRLLLENPHQLDLLRQHPELIPDAIEETLRFDAPIHLYTRVAAEDTDLGGVPVRAGELAQLMVGAAHHDPDSFQDPHIFDVGRRRRQVAASPSAGPSSHLGFGAGIHYCLGSSLARLEATALITSIVKRSPPLRINTPPVWAPRVAFRRMTSLHLALA